jgi:predicted AAA+ superfamily ATPase
MPHSRKRHLAPVLKQVMAFSPLVGVLGHRQVGKTTLLENSSAHYLSLDDAQTLAYARTSPADFLKEHAHQYQVIDECQEAPELFPALKDWVRKHPKPGQFLLSGSVRFTSLELIKESLTGRIINLELYPFIMSEIWNSPLCTEFKSQITRLSFDRLLSDPPLAASIYRSKIKDIHSYFERGGLPGVFHIRSEQLRAKKYEQYLLTMIDRDLRRVVPTRLAYPVLRNLLVCLADRQGHPIELKALQDETGISTPTLKKLLFGLQAIFLIRQVRVEGGKKGECYYFEDQGEQTHLTRQPPSRLRSFEHFCYVQLRAQFEYDLGDPVDVFQYQTRGGARVPLVFRTKKGSIGVFPLQELKDANQYIPSAKSFLNSVPQSQVMMLHMGRESALLHPKIAVLPIMQLL